MHHERAEHVFVCFTGRWTEHPAPGLLLSWRQREGVGWEGWGIAAEPAPPGCDGGDGAPVVGVPAAAIRPLDPSG